jgi:NAD(P)-dependent dehydrogenase (short-subunit alcohol dehydrogenase family)
MISDVRRLRGQQIGANLGSPNGGCELQVLNREGKQMSEFSGKVAIVTGGSSGIGRAAAVAFAQQGAKVVVASRRSDWSQETLSLVRQAGSDGFFAKTDVTRERDVKAMVEETVKAYGRLDCAFNNAGIEQLPQPISDQACELYDQIMDVNVKGVWLSMKHEIPAMLTGGGGAIVNMSSVKGVLGFSGAPIYAASKHAVIGLTKSLALEYAQSGIRINAICPAGVETHMFRRAVSGTEGLRERATAEHPMGRIADPGEIASVVLWLCSAGSAYVTGHSLLVDGGFTAK